MQVRIIIIRKAKTKKILVWNPYTLLLEMQIALSTMEISMVLPPKPKNGTIARTVISLVNIHPKDSKEICNNIVCCLYSLKSLMLIRCNSTVHRYCPHDSGPKH